jgi:hypothetical protein
MSQWTGEALREWAELAADHIDAGRLTMTMDLDRCKHQDVWTVTMTRTGKKSE